MRSYLQCIDICDQLPRKSFQESVNSKDCFVERLDLTKFVVSGCWVGYLRRSVVEALRQYSKDDFLYNLKYRACLLNDKYNTQETISKLLNEVAQFWRSQQKFSVLEGWRNEQYNIYDKENRVLFTLERAATALFGVVTFGCHMTMFIPSTETAPMQIWCPRRSATKATFPGMLDNTVAGGVSDNRSPWSTIIKEAEEEASITESIALRSIRPTGAISYIYIDGDSRNGEGWIQPEVQYVYDMPLLGADAALVPRPNDDEVQGFALWDVDRVKQEMLAGNFKPNCALVLIDFFIRHGVITSENEKDYIEIIARIHRTFEVPAT